MENRPFSQNSLSPDLLSSFSYSNPPNLIPHEEKMCITKEVPILSQPFPKLPSIHSIFGDFLHHSVKGNDSYYSKCKLSSDTKKIYNNCPDPSQMGSSYSPTSKDKDLNSISDRMQAYSLSADNKHVSAQKQPNWKEQNSRASIGNETLQASNSVNRSNMPHSRVLTAVSTEQQSRIFYSF